LKGKNSGI